MRLSVAVAVACLLLVGLSAANESEAAIRKHTNIPAQDLGAALQSLATHRNFQIVYVAEEVNSLRTQGAIGEFTSEEALSHLLSGTGLAFRYLDERTVTVFPPTTKHQATKPTSALLPLPARETMASEATNEESPGWFSRLRLALAQNDQTVRTDSSSGQHKNSENSSEDSQKRVGLEEIIVTAQKRAENIQDVPLSITAISADEIDRRRLVSAEDYLRGIPGVNQVEHPFGQAIVIRGIETVTTSQNFLTGPTVATYFGETPTTNSAGLSGGSNVDLKLVDIERLEVLRGPQGTAFGNASMGGAVRTIPVAPKLDDFEGKVAAGYSGTSGTGGDNYNVQAVGNLPLIRDKLAIRATAYQYEDSGYYRNVAGSDAAFQAAVVTRYGAEAFATDEEEVGSYYVIGGRIATLFQASDDLRFTLSYLSQNTETNGFPTASSGTGAYDQTMLQIAPEHVVRGQRGGQVDKDIDIANAMMEYNLGWADLLATYSHTKSRTTESYAYTIFGSAFPGPASAYSPNDHRENVGEIRLATRLDGAWNFLAGLYAEELKDELSFDERWYGDPATNFFAPGARLLGVMLDRRNLRQKAAYGEASWELLQGLTLTGGVRGYEYDRTFRFDGTGPFWGDLHLTRDTEASGENLRANLSYKVDDGALLYAGWSQGFRLGMLQRGLPPGVCDLNSDGIVDGTNITIESSTRVDSDAVDSYELGAKFALLDRRVTIAADLFRMEWSDIPVAVRAGVLGVNCGFVYTANAGEALSEGVELQANFQITEAFRIDLGGSRIHARLTKDAPAANAFRGTRLPGSPEVNANLSLQYDFEIGGYKTSVRADSIYVEPFYGDLPRSPNLRAGDYVKLDASARVAIGNLNIDLLVRNLTNEDAFTFRGSNARSGEFYGYRLRPRTIGLQFGYSF